MSGRQIVLASLLGLLVVALFFFGVAVGSDRDRADPDASGGVELIDEVLGRLPGLGDRLDPDEIDAACFDGRDRFTVDATAGCTFLVPEGVDRAQLRYRSGACVVRVTGQEDTLDQRLGPKQARDGVLRLGLDGGGARVTISGGPCELELVA